jgi:hypothetical protein
LRRWARSSGERCCNAPSMSSGSNLPSPVTDQHVQCGPAWLGLVAATFLTLAWSGRYITHNHRGTDAAKRKKHQRCRQTRPLPGRAIVARAKAMELPEERWSRRT